MFQNVPTFPNTKLRTSYLSEEYLCGADKMLGGRLNGSFGPLTSHDPRTSAGKVTTGAGC